MLLVAKRILIYLGKQEVSFHPGAAARPEAGVEGLRGQEKTSRGNDIGIMWKRLSDS